MWSVMFRPLVGAQVNVNLIFVSGLPDYLSARRVAEQLVEEGFVLVAWAEQD